MLKLAKYSASRVAVDEVASFNLDAKISGQVMNCREASRNLRRRLLMSLEEPGNA